MTDHIKGNEVAEPNWVDKRAHREAILSAGAPEVWAAARSAIMDACDSFNRCYGQGKMPVECAMENGKRIRIKRTIFADRVQRFQDTVLEVLVTFIPESATIAMARQNASRKYSIIADDSSAYVTDGETRLSADDLSCRILQPLLFNAID